MQPMKFGVGQAVRRQEDDAFLRGAGHYVSDHTPAGLLEAVVVRSPHAHARFRIADAEKARAMPGVALVLTGADTGKLGNLPCLGEVPGARIDVPRRSTRLGLAPRQASGLLARQVENLPHGKRRSLATL